MVPESPDLAELAADPRPFLDHPEAPIRRLAVSAATPHLADAAVRSRLEDVLRIDPADEVRAEAAQVLAGVGPPAEEPLLQAAHDGSAVVVEAVAFALGEIESKAAVPWLIATARDHPDALAREAAVASLGAIGDPAGLPLLLELAGSGPPQLRRRSVVALSGYGGDRAQVAIQDALHDRNPMVREVAELLIGRPAGTEPLPWPTSRSS